MQYTELTKKELQREYDRVARKYQEYVRNPLTLDMAAADDQEERPCQRAKKHFGTVLYRELRDTGAASPAEPENAVAVLNTLPGCATRTVELCRKAGVCFAAVDHNTVLARIIPEDARSDELTHAASVFALSARMAALESMSGSLQLA